MIAQRLRDAHGWWLATELCRRHSGLRIVGAHSPSGGVVLLAGPTAQGGVVAEFSELVHAGPITDWSTILQAYRLSDILVRIESGLFGAVASPSATNPRTLVYRVLSRIAMGAAIAGPPVRIAWAPMEPQVQNGPYPFSNFPGALHNIEKRLSMLHPNYGDLLFEEDPFGPQNPVEWTWVVMRDDRPALLVDEGGWLHDGLGGHRNLVTAYSATHDLDALYTKLILPVV